MTDHPAPPPFRDLLRVNLRRRGLLGGAIAAAALAGAGLPLLGRARASAGGLLGFRAVAIAEGGGPNPAISPDYRFDVILPWGEPLEPGGPAFAWPARAADQARQLGIGHDGMWLFPIRDAGAPRGGWDVTTEANPWQGAELAASAGNEHGVLCLNHEFGTNAHVLGKAAPQSLGDVRASQHAHGVSVVALRRSARSGRWETAASPLARRVHANTPVRFGGPAAGHALLRTAAGDTVLGTLANCASGYTPWGTYLTCEENFHGYFGTDDPAWAPTALQARYGLTRAGAGYGWHRFDPRFDLAATAHRNEENRFGWVVEVDPFDPVQVPVKRTALGRCKHEGATVHVADDGRVVVYLGDDEPFEHIYKFVSADDWRAMRARGESPLDHGTLYVARFEEDGTGRWLELSLGVPALAARFADLGELLVGTRIAADVVGATPMDRPEWLAVGADGQVYCSLTNNTRRTTPNGPNPRAPNPDGHIVRWRETDGHAGRSFAWDVFLIAADTHRAGREDTLSAPDGLWADPDGRLFIQTDGDQQGGLNNQLLVADTATGELRRLFTGVPGCEITGFAMTPDRRTLFVNVQHPGDGDPALTNFPVMCAVPDGKTVPRDATVVITRKDGGIVGS
jgi:uncharacterized protein